MACTIWHLVTLAVTVCKAIQRMVFLLIIQLIVSAIITTVVLSNTSNYATCADWMKNSHFGSLTDGVHQIYSNDTQKSIDVYCRFDYYRNYSFTLIESASLVSMQSATLLAYAPFTANITYNIDNVDYYRMSIYRMSREWMIHLLEQESNLLFSTCNFNTNFTKDWILINLNEIESDHNPFYYNTGDCFNVVSLNIRGHQCLDTSIFMQQAYDLHLSADSNYSLCSCTAVNTGSVAFEYDFGMYLEPNFNTKKFSCSSRYSSTTNWWLGEKVSKFIYIPTVQPREIPPPPPPQCQV